MNSTKCQLLTRILIGICIILSSSSIGFGQSCDTSLLSIRQVRASDTDPAISFELYKHFVYYNPDCAPVGKLMIYMVGTWGNPVLNQVFPSIAANHGFHVISLKYPNNIYASQYCAADSNTSCYENFRREALYGVDVSDSLSIDSTNSIYNRAFKLLTYLDQTYPSENWGQYLNSTDIAWSKVIPAGHSQGSGHAAFMGHEFNVHRVLMFAGPNEHSTYYNTPASWLSDAMATPDSNFYVFNNSNDEIASFANQLLGMIDMGLPAFGDTMNIDNANCPYYNRRMLYTSRLFTGGVSVNHGSVVADAHTPYDMNGIPEFVPVWEYMLGICTPVTSIQENNETFLALVYPNPVSGTLNFQLPNQLSDAITLKIYEKLGKEIFSLENTSSKRIAIDTRSFDPGMYFYFLYDEKDHKRVMGKFIKQ